MGRNDLGRIDDRKIYGSYPISNTIVIEHLHYGLTPEHRHPEHPDLSGFLDPAATPQPPRTTGNAQPAHDTRLA